MSMDYKALSICLKVLAPTLHSNIAFLSLTGSNNTFSSQYIKYQFPSSDPTPRVSYAVRLPWTRLRPTTEVSPLKMSSRNPYNGNPSQSNQAQDHQNPDFQNPGNQNQDQQRRAIHGQGNQYPSGLNQGQGAPPSGHQSQTGAVPQEPLFHPAGWPHVQYPSGVTNQQGVVVPWPSQVVSSTQSAEGRVWPSEVMNARRGQDGKK